MAADGFLRVMLDTIAARRWAWGLACDMFYPVSDRGAKKPIVAHLADAFHADLHLPG